MKNKVFSILLLICLFSPAMAQQSKFVETDDFRQHYLEFGKGEETIVLIHGMADTAEVWKKIAPLMAKNLRVIAFDRRGVGKSLKTKSGYSLQSFAEDVRNLLEKLKIDKAHLVGHSFGGSIAMIFAANYPEKLKTLTLIEGGFWEKREKTPEIPKCPQPIEEDCLISNEILAESYNYDPEILYPKINVPTLFLMGLPNFSKQPGKRAEKAKIEKEFGIIAQIIKSTAENKLKNGSFAVITNAEHWVFNDQPRLTAAQILSFIKANQSNQK